MELAGVEGHVMDFSCVAWRVNSAAMSKHSINHLYAQGDTGGEYLTGGQLK